MIASATYQARFIIYGKVAGVLIAYQTFQLGDIEIIENNCKLFLRIGGFNQNGKYINIDLMKQQICHRFATHLYTNKDYTLINFSLNKQLLNGKNDIPVKIALKKLKILYYISLRQRNDSINNFDMDLKTGIMYYVYVGLGSMIAHYLTNVCLNTAAERQINRMKYQLIFLIYILPF